MRKILISILIVALLVLTYFTVTNGLNIFGLKILSIKEIADKNEELDKKIEEVSQLTSVSYPKAKKDLETSTAALLREKDEYADLVSFSTSDDVDAASKLPVYDMEYLRTRLGTYATKNGIKIKIDVIAGSASGQYNLNFTATGRYVGIIEFISAIENDTSFSFRIQSFKLIPQSDTETLQATFTVENVSINNINKVTTQTTTTTTETGTNNTNTTSTTDNTANTTENNTANTTGNNTDTTNTTTTDNTTNTTQNNS